MSLKGSAFFLVMVAMSTGLSGAPAQDAPSALVRAMKAHYVQVGVLQEAVIRGDLRAARAAATMLAKSEVPDLPASVAAQHKAIRTVGERVASATDIGSAAAGTASILGVCADCHRAAGVAPAPKLPERPAVGEAVGHMLDHQRATDRLMQGLLIPSATLWEQGAQGLREAPLDVGKLPKDPKLTSEVVAAEKRVHALADQAAAATEAPARIAVYGQVLGTCATCHALHSHIWGPGMR